MTPLVILFAQYRDDDSGMSGRDPTLSVVSLLPLIYVVLDRTAGTLAICLFVASIGCALFALQPPPACQGGFQVRVVSHRNDALDR